MKLQLSLYILLLTLIYGCSTPVPYTRTIGYIEEGGNDSLLIVRENGKHGKRLFFNLTDKTHVERENLIQGNIVEVEYLAPTTAIKYDASVVTASPTYRKALGVWQTSKDKGLKINIELLPYGEIEQSSPKDILLFEHWQLTPTENEIELIGSVATPIIATPPQDDKETNKQKEAAIEREPMSFHTRVTIENIDGEDIMLFHNDTAHTTRLTRARVTIK